MCELGKWKSWNLLMETLSLMGSCDGQFSSLMEEGSVFYIKSWIAL